MSAAGTPGATGFSAREVVGRWFPGLEVHGVRPLEGGWMNDVFGLESAVGPLVLRVLQPETTAEMTAWSHSLLDRVAPRLPTVLAPIRTPEGASMVEVDGRLATLERFVDGRLGDRSGRDVEPAGRALGALHRTLLEAGDLADELGARPGYPSWTELDWRENRWWSWGGVDRGMVEARVDLGVLDRAIEEVPGELASVASSAAGRALVTMPIHADYHEENLLVGGDGEVAAIIDWDECRVDWRAWDVANGLWSLCRNEGSTNLMGWQARAFLESYEAASGVGVPAEERAVFALCVRATRLYEALWGLGEMQRGHAGWDYLQQNIAAIAGIGELDLG